MTIQITRKQIMSIAHRAREEYLLSFEMSAEALARYGVTANPRRVAHFMAQVLEETGGLRVTDESLYYTTPARLVAVWPSRFAIDPDPGSKKHRAADYVRNEEKLADVVYLGRMGNDQPGDGYRYRGRGLLQITGREAYRKYGEPLGIDLEAEPDLALDPRYAVAIAAAEWEASGCNPLADAGDFRKETIRINGGLTNFNDRKWWLGQTSKIWR